MNIASKFTIWDNKVKFFILYNVIAFNALYTLGTKVYTIYHCKPNQ